MPRAVLGKIPPLGELRSAGGGGHMIDEQSNEIITDSSGCYEGNEQRCDGDWLWEVTIQGGLL